jgi:membrane-associated phospholipid phosphatase
MICATLFAARPAFGQAIDPSVQSAVCGLAHPALCLKDVAKDQAGIWTSPFRTKPGDTAWLLPLAGATAFALHYDLQAMKTLGSTKSRLDVSKKVARFGSPYATAAGAAGLYVIGLGTHNEHLTETGRLAGEAIADAALVGEVLKLATNRQPVDTGNGQGGFWPHGTSSFVVSSSFPSGHAITTWAMARVIASEYPKKPLQITVYAFATAISLCRVTGRAHFPSDVVVGSAFGYLIGGYVKRHHASERPI